ncbi:MAG: enoyl-CoA hydratase/isomerase family protein [Nitrospirota bacterium]
MNHSLILTRKQATVGCIEINRPDKANSYNQAVLNELGAALERMKADSDVAVLVISGAGERSFCAGADLNEMQKKDYSDALNLTSAKVFASIASYPKVTIAAINGAAVAGGLELALACDIRICSDTSRFFFPETKLGLIPAAGGTRRLQQVVGIAKAKELILGGRVWAAEDALNFGLVSEVLHPDELQTRAQQWGEEIGERNHLALQLAKKAMDVETSYNVESSYESVAEALLYQIKMKE